MWAFLANTLVWQGKVRNCQIEEIEESLDVDLIVDVACGLGLGSGLESWDMFATTPEE